MYIYKTALCFLSGKAKQTKQNNSGGGRGAGGGGTCMRPGALMRGRGGGRACEGMLGACMCSSPSPHQCLANDRMHAPPASRLRCSALFVLLCLKGNTFFLKCSNLFICKIPSLSPPFAPLSKIQIMKSHTFSTNCNR